VNENHLENKVIFKGMVQPEELRHATKGAYIGITLFSREGKSNYYSLANRFFDYIHAATPQVCVDYPVYKELNDEYDIAVLVSDLTPPGLAQSIGLLLEDKALWDRLHQNCIAAAKVLNWQHEEIKLLAFYKRILG
jgi:hypothetical protein